MLKEVGIHDALDAYLSGLTVRVVIQSRGKEMLAGLEEALGGARFLVDEGKRGDSQRCIEREGRTKRKLDTGKLLALYKAGWMVTDIARDLRVSEDTVRNYLKKLEEKKEG